MDKQTDPTIQLKTLRDEVLLKVHLLEMEAKQKWVEFEPQLERVISKVENASTQTIQKMLETLQKFNTSINR